ncbi:copper-binding protein [Sulfuriferula plumbiphila]|nr:copper-binding protein [Sulfuriferula plumbiphila]BBP04360.1 hypothetical protein SFPGR_17820 [Sulfuriferula plumbiphila]
MKKLHFILVPVVLAAFFTVPASGADMPNMAGMKMETPTTAVGKGHKGKGIVNSVDLAMLKPGQHVDFELSEKAKGQYLVTKIAPAK